MKKRIIPFFTLIILILNFSCLTSFAGTDNTIITVSSVQAKSGETVEIPVILSGNTGFSNLAIEIGYNSNVMTLTNVTSPVSGASFTTAQNFTAEPYNMQWDSPNDVLYNGTLAVLSFEIKSGAKSGIYPINVDYYKGRNGDNIDGEDINYKANYDSLNLTYTGGNITVKSSGSGTVPSFDVSGISFGVKLTADEYTGDVWAGMYDDSNRLVCVKQYPAAENVNISFEKGMIGAYVKIMWWESSSLRPLCNAQIIPLH